MKRNAYGISIWKKLKIAIKPIVFTANLVNVKSKIL